MLDKIAKIANDRHKSSHNITWINFEIEDGLVFVEGRPDPPLSYTVFISFPKDLL